MLRQFSYLFAYILLALTPIQGLATANMLVCNSMMQINATNQSETKQSVDSMPCHQHIADVSSSSNSNQSDNYHQSSCKSSCASVCANMCALTTMPAHTQNHFALNLSQVFDFNHQTYASITQPNLQRPPISFI